MAPYSPDNKSRQDGINPWGLIAAVLIFVCLSIVLSWMGLRYFAGENIHIPEDSQIISQVSDQPSGTSAPISPVEAGVPDNGNGEEAISTDITAPAASNPTEAKAATNKKTASTSTTAPKTTAATSNIPKPVKAAEKPREPKPVEQAVKKPVAQPTPGQTEITVKETAKPSSLLTPGDIQKRMETGIPENVEKVPEKSVSNGPVEWYAVQVGYTDSWERANILTDVLKNQGFTEAQTTTGADGYFFVTVGKYQFRYEAELASKTVQDKTGLSPRVYEKTIAQ